jgi:hypothetical protein
MPNLKKDP